MPPPPQPPKRLPTACRAIEEPAPNAICDKMCLGATERLCADTHALGQGGHKTATLWLLRHRRGRLLVRRNRPSWLVSTKCGRLVGLSVPPVGLARLRIFDLLPRIVRWRRRRRWLFVRPVHEIGTCPASQPSMRTLSAALDLYAGCASTVINWCHPVLSVTHRANCRRACRCMHAVGAVEDHEMRRDRPRSILPFVPEHSRCLYLSPARPLGFLFGVCVMRGLNSE